MLVTVLVTKVTNHKSNPCIFKNQCLWGVVWARMGRLVQCWLCPGESAPRLLHLLRLILSVPAPGAGTPVVHMNQAMSSVTCLSLSLSGPQKLPC